MEKSCEVNFCRAFAVIDAMSMCTSLAHTHTHTLHTTQFNIYKQKRTTTIQP